MYFSQKIIIMKKIVLGFVYISVYSCTRVLEFGVHTYSCTRVFEFGVHTYCAARGCFIRLQTGIYYMIHDVSTIFGKQHYVC